MSNVSSSVGIKLSVFKLYDKNYAGDAALLVENKENIVPSYKFKKKHQSLDSMSSSDNEDPESCSGPNFGDLTINDAPVSAVTNFCYRGWILTFNSNSHDELHWCIGIALSTMYRMNHVWNQFTVSIQLRSASTLAA